jgi:hypothetical protein
MDDFVMQAQCDEMTSFATLEDWQEYHEWLESIESKQGKENDE